MACLPPDADLLCKFLCKAPVSGTKQLDNHHFVGNATGIMPVWLYHAFRHAKRRRVKGLSPLRGLGRRPRQVWAEAQRFQSAQEKVVSEQTAQRSTIETGWIRKAGIQTQNSRIDIKGYFRAAKVPFCLPDMV